MSKRVVCLMIGVGAGLGSLLAGCEDPQAQVRIAHRAERRQMWLDYAAEEEANGVWRLRQMDRWLADIHARGVAKYDQIPERFRELYARDLADWDRGKAWMGDLVSKDLQGNPELARWAAITMLY